MSRRSSFFLAAAASKHPRSFRLCLRCSSPTRKGVSGGVAPAAGPCIASSSRRAARAVGINMAGAGEPRRREERRVSGIGMGRGVAARKISFSTPRRGLKPFAFAPASLSPPPRALGRAPGGRPGALCTLFLAARRSVAAAIMAAREPLLESAALGRGREGGWGRLPPAPRPRRPRRPAGGRAGSPFSAGAAFWRGRRPGAAGAGGRARRRGSAALFGGAAAALGEAILASGAGPGCGARPPPLLLLLPLAQSARGRAGAPGRRPAPRRPPPAGSSHFRGTFFHQEAFHKMEDELLASGGAAAAPSACRPRPRRRCPRPAEPGGRGDLGGGEDGGRRAERSPGRPRRAARPQLWEQVVALAPLRAPASPPGPRFPRVFSPLRRARGLSSGSGRGGRGQFKDTFAALWGLIDVIKY